MLFPLKQDVLRIRDDPFFGIPRVVLMGTSPENLIVKADYSLTEHAAMSLLSAAMDKASDLGFKASIAVVNRAGSLMGFIRMSGSFLVSAELSQCKARCAAGLGVETAKLEEILMHEKPRVREGLLANDGFTLIGGGIPLTWTDCLVGGIGVSGGSEVQDIECAQAAVNCLLAGKT